MDTPPEAVAAAAAAPDLQRPSSRKGPAGRNLRRKDAADRLGVHPNTLYSWAQRGIVEVVELPNGEVRYPEASVEALREKLGL